MGWNCKSVRVCRQSISRQLHLLLCLPLHKHICTVFFDYSKAFDTIPRRLLLQKLQNYGVHQQILRWLTHYLCSSTQYVCVNGSSSDILPVSSVVPQGSVLGPLLFIIYIDDITDLQLSDGSMTLFADDIILYRPICTPADYSLLQLDIDDICTWTTNNLLIFNSNKCKYKFSHTGTSVFSLPLLWPGLYRLKVSVKVSVHNPTLHTFIMWKDM